MKEKLVTQKEIEERIQKAESGMHVIYHSVFPAELLNDINGSELIDEDDSLMISPDKKTAMTIEDCPIEVYKMMLQQMSVEQEKCINKLVPVVLIDSKNNIIYYTEKY